MRDWKTTLAGILTIVGSCCTAGIAFLKGQPMVAATALTAGIPTGIGLIKASDSKKIQ